MAAKLTPMMQQYQELKSKHKDCLLLFRLGDFYELFFEDAIEASRILNLTLTHRQAAPMCGMPHHALDSYVGRLTRLGKKVALCEQLSDPSLPGIVKRDVVRVITPGTTFDERILDQKSHNFIVSITFPSDAKSSIGLAACDLTTGLLHVAAINGVEDLKEELFRLNPAECIVDAAEKNIPNFLKNFAKMAVFPHQFWDEPKKFICAHFGVKNLSAFEIEDMSEVIHAGAMLLHYLRETQKSDLSHVQAPRLLHRDCEMILDETAIRNLELVMSMREGKREGSLLSVIDMTKTAMGARMLRMWVLHPLHNKAQIEERLDAVDEIKNDTAMLTKLSEIVANLLDMERLLGRLSIGSGNARDILGIGISLGALSKTKTVLAHVRSTLLENFHKEFSSLSPLDELREAIMNSIVAAPPLSVRDGGIIKSGVNKELDELRALSSEGKSFIQKMQEQEIQNTGINSLKIRYNTIFGYYIEITKANLHAVPTHYIRKQTVVNAERFITPELKEYEEKILGAEEKMKEREYQIFLHLREEVKKYTREIQTAADIFAKLDGLSSCALVAQAHGYVRPKIVEASESLEIKNGRHPVVEHLAGGQFVANDVNIHEAERVLLITGPNMGGKSTYLRQTALIVLLAHMGSFVPAESAKIPLIDRIFTRVGANDNLVRGQSTFMVEMQETAHILHYATKNSLIILDEIGRGTSTYDGVSLAWAILEFIHDTTKAKALFATHYHELIQVAERLAHAENYSVAVKEEHGEVVFLYRVIEGAVDRSYGIEVARLAGLPQSVIAKAKNILHDLEEGVVDKAVQKKATAEMKNELQMGLFQERPHRVIEELKNVNVNKMTPLEALQKLDQLKNMEK